MTTEPTETTLTPAQESDQIALMAKPSILNIAKNKEAYEALRDECAGITLPEFKDPEFKKTHKKVTELSGRLVKARTAATKLVKQEKDTLKQVITLIEAEGDKLIAITAESEKEIKSLKETADGWIEDDKQEQLRQIEEQKQARMVELLNLGFTAKPGYYELGDLNVTQMQLIQSTTAQWEGTIAQAKVVYEAEQLRLAEEAEKEAKRIADEKKSREEAEEAQRKAQELLAKENEAKQRELDAAKAKQKEQDDLIASLQAQIKAQEATKPNALEMLPLADIKPLEAPKNGSAIKFTEDQRESILNDVLVAEEAVKGDEDFKTVSATLNFSTSHPYLDTKIGNSIFRVYPEEFLDIVNTSVPEGMEAKRSGDFGKDMLYLVLTPIK